MENCKEKGRGRGDGVREGGSTEVQWREERGRKVGKQSVVYFYRMHSRSCPLKIHLHVFLIPTDGNKINLDVRLS